LVVDRYVFAEKTLEGTQSGTFAARLGEHLGRKELGSAGTDKSDLATASGFGDYELGCHVDSYMWGEVIRRILVVNSGLATGGLIEGNFD
jgi:hypothetical protein